MDSARADSNRLFKPEEHVLGCRLTDSVFRTCAYERTNCSRGRPQLADCPLLRSNLDHGSGFVDRLRPHLPCGNFDVWQASNHPRSSALGSVCMTKDTSFMT